MSWKWKDLLQSIPLFVEQHSLLTDVVTQLNDQNINVCFVFDKQPKHIVGYVTTHSLLNQLTNSNGKTDEKIKIKPLTNFLYVHEQNRAQYIHNCPLVIGANSQHEPTGYLFMNELESQLNELKLKNINVALNSAEMGVVVLNSSFQVQFMNEKAEQILGISLSILQNRDYRLLIKMNKSLNDILSGQTWFGIENTFNSKVISGQFSPIYEQGEIVGIIHNFYLKDHFNNSVHEVQFVKEMNDYLQAFYQSSNEQIIIVEPNGLIEKLTGSFFEQFWQGIDRHTLRGTHLNDLAKDQINFGDIVSSCIKKKSKVMMKQKRNNVTLLSTATPILENDIVKKVFILSKDISTTKDSNNELSIENYDLQKDRKIVYRSNKITHLLNEVEAVSPFDSTILITGESGVGKEVFARRIHSLSRRKDAPFVAINCGAIPENIIESELFGHEKGAFTGATDMRVGLFEHAHNGTVFLDEIGELPYLMQVRLLRVLQEKEVTRVGSSVPIKVNVRIIAATNKNLKQLVQENKFREDLYYRLHVVPLVIPALRDRKEDIAPLAIHFLNDFNQLLTDRKTISPKAITMLESYSWPGNVRELENVIERLIVTTKATEITEQDVYSTLWETDSEEQSHLMINKIMPLKDAVEETEKQLIQLAMQTYNTATDAAKALNVSVSTVSRRMKKYSRSGGRHNDILF